MNEQKKKSKIIIILALLVIAIAVIIGFSIYNNPSNRLSRQLDLGEKYLEEENYEQAVVEFDKAIAIDPMNERAYVGKAEAYVGMGDYEQAAATYKTAVQTVPDGEEVWNAAEQFYLDYAQSYIDDGDLESAVDVLEEGDDLLDSDRLKDKLEEVRIAYEEQGKQQAAEELEARLQECLRQIYEYMTAGNYTEAGAVFFSFFTVEEIQGILLAWDGILYFPDENAEKTGIGIGLYACQMETADSGLNNRWYIYYGNYVNGQREGNGTYSRLGGRNLESVFNCEWSGDTPNGYGEWIERLAVDTDGVFDYEQRITGNFIGGLLDGDISYYFRYGNSGSRVYGVPLECEVHFSAVEGVPEDRTEEYFAYREELYRREGWPSDTLYQTPYEGEEYAYAIGEYLNMPTGKYGHWACWILPGETIGVAGFADVDMLHNTKSGGEGN